MFDIKNPDTFLGGQNVHNLLILAALGYVIYNQMEMQKKFASVEGDMSEFSNIFGRKKQKSVYGGRKKVADAVVIDDYDPASGGCKPPKFYCAALKRCVSSTTRCDKAIDRKWN